MIGGGNPAFLVSKGILSILSGKGINLETKDRLERLLEKAHSLPLQPGVYLMRDRGGRVIYVGKSRKLKNRVSQYFRGGDKNAKTERMVSQVYDFDYMLCDTEMEALTLENTLIKQYTPKYNIRLKDAKSYPYLKITAGEYPRIVFTRRRDSDRAKYFWSLFRCVGCVFGVAHAPKDLWASIL